MQFPQLSDVDAFVRWEEEQELKYEFAEGTVSLFRGASLRHELMVINIGSALHGALGPGLVRGSSLKQLTETSSRYPDISVGAPGREAPDATASRYPVLLIEVLSKSTQATDRGPKFDEYRSIETLEEYVVIDSRKRWAQTIRRHDGEWIVSLPILSGTLEFRSVGAIVSFDEIYAGTDL